MIRYQATPGILPRAPERARRIGWAATLVAGTGAGIFILLAMLASSTVIYDESAWKLPRMLAAVALGREVLQPEDEFAAAIVATGIAIHFALALLFATAIASLCKDLPARFAPWLGLAAGAALYFANLHGFTHLFPWFAELRTLDILAAHLLFGIVAANIHRALTRAR